MAGSNLLSLYNSIKASRTKRFSCCLHPIRRFTGSRESGGVEVKAASLAEEFERVSEEKANHDRAVREKEKENSGSCSSSQETLNIAQESVFGESDVRSAVKRKYKEPPNSGDD